MILVGQYDSPFVRRVAISLKVLGLSYEHDTRSVFGDFESMLKTNPLGRIPSLLFDDGRTLVDSAAILDWLDESVGPKRALLPPSGAARVERVAAHRAGDGHDRQDRRRELRADDPPVCISLAGMDRAPAHAMPRRPAKRSNRLDWTSGKLDQAQITTGCMLFYIRVTDPAMLPAGRYPALDKLAARLGVMPEFRETAFTDYAIPRAQ